MTRDYKSRAEARSAPKRQRFCLIWLAAGFLLGAFGVGLLWLQADPGLMRSGSALAKTGIPRPKVSENRRPPVSTSLEFEFPRLLRKMEVLVPDDEEPVTKAAAPQVQPKKPPAEQVQAPPNTPSADTSAPAKRVPEAYVLQIGSFREAGDAERLRAQLALMGVETRVQKVTIDGKDAFHRVRSPPFRSQKELDAVRQLLTKNSIKSIVIKWKG